MCELALTGPSKLSAPAQTALCRVCSEVIYQLSGVTRWYKHTTQNYVLQGILKTK